MTMQPDCDESRHPGLRILRLMLLLTALVAAAAILYAAERARRDDQAEHAHCRGRAIQVVEALACSCILEREDSRFRHVVVLVAPQSWRETWHRAIHNECRAEAHMKLVTDFGIADPALLPTTGSIDRLR